ncbi:MAG: ABC transporter ATP-binding protein [Planctomycetota bacterium]|nr:ABC transporter ATP-binding protein [Planctomycetota bacterium]
MNKDSLAIDCTELFKTYPGKPAVEAVRGVDLQVYSGECFGVLGPNGAGKTTTIEILEGLLPPTSGSVRVLDRDWSTQEADIRQRVGVSLQETKLSDRLTVAETTALFRSFYQDGLTPEEALELVDLTEKSRSWVKTLSGGQKQRLAVALAIVGDPDLLFLDEPTTGLDPGSRRQLWDIIRSFRARNKTVMITTHYMEEAERLCDRVAIFDQGRVIALGTPRELIASLGAEHVIEFKLPPELADSQRQALMQSLNNTPSLEQPALKDSTVHITTADVHAALRQLFELLERQKVEISSLTTRHASLEDVFVHLTGRHLNEGLAG